MTQTPVLALLDYSKTFVVETDASGVRIGAVLQQEGQLIAYLSKTLTPKHQTLSTYEKKFLAVLMALEKWRSYLLDRHFKIKTDHFSLKYLLNQRVTTPFQAKWLPKLLGFNYEISYNKGSDNVVVDSLFRITNESELNSLILSTITSELLQKFQGSYVNDLALQKVIQKQKADLAAYPGLLQPLPIPEKIWSEISMDFIVGMPKSQGKTMIFMVVGRLSKFYELPNSIVSDRDSVFLSLFWQSLFKLLKLPLAEYCYNTNKHSSINVTPYEVVYGQTPPLRNPYVAGESVVESVDRSLQARKDAIEMIKFHITRAQDRMKRYADLKRSKREFDVGMWVYLKLQPHRQVTIRKSVQNKLSAKYSGSFLIISKVGTVAYKLELPKDSKIHPVFHVSQLKLCKGTDLKMGILPHCGKDGLPAVEPEAILDRRMAKLNNRAAVYVLVKWVNHSEEDAKWELYEDLALRFPEFLIDP
nr:reverse transcriptase [Tanacetum cinerariifolium]